MSMPNEPVHFENPMLKEVTLSRIIPNGAESVRLILRYARDGAAKAGTPGNPNLYVVEMTKGSVWYGVYSGATMPLPVGCLVYQLLKALPKPLGENGVTLEVTVRC